LISFAKQILKNTLSDDHATKDSNQLSFPLIGNNCEDKDSRCAGWTGYCSYHRYVRENCKKTCRLC